MDLIEIDDDEGTHSTFMRLLSSVSPHMHYQHVLSFEWFLVPGTADPAANERLLAGVNVVCVNVLDQVVLGRELELAVHLGF